MIAEPRDFDAWDFEYRPGGWVRARNQTGITVFFRVVYIGDDDGKRRPSIRTAIMDSPQPISARSWRTAPFAEAEMFLDAEWAPNVYEVLTQPADADAVGDLGAYFDRTADKYRNIEGIALTDTIIGGAENFEMVRDPGGRITDEFLQNLAAMYRWAGPPRSSAPAVVIAESADVPVTRVHRWVAQARKRGFLPPAIKGKAG